MKDIEKTVYNAIKNGTYTTFDTLKDSYVHLYEEIIALQAENARLTEQLKNAVVLPMLIEKSCSEEFPPLYELIYKSIYGIGTREYIDKEEAQKSLVELKGDN